MRRYPSPISVRYALLLLASKNVLRTASPLLLRRRQDTLQVPAKGRRQSRPRSACRLISNYMNKVVEWFDDAGVKDLSECDNIVLWEYTTSAKGIRPAAGETSSVTAPQELAAEDRSRSSSSTVVRTASGRWMCV